MQAELKPADSKQLEVHGNRLSVIIAGRVVNVSALARQLNINQSNLSKFLSGQRQYTPAFARSVAYAIGISTDRLMDAIDSRRLETTLQA